jgi:adenine/guanine/hypoxanthine permease
MQFGWTWRYGFSFGGILPLIGVILTGVLLALKVKGALLIGIFTVTVAGIPFGVTHLPESSLT